MTINAAYELLRRALVSRDPSIIARFHTTAAAQVICDHLTGGL